MVSIINACKDPNFPAQVVGVVSDNKDAAGLEYAEKEGIPTKVVSRSDYSSKSEFEQELLKQLGRFKFECLCLAGFMRVLSPEILDRLDNKVILNIHPSLLPKHKGLNVHKRVLKAGDRKSGCTVHMVTADVDSGEIILQKEVPVYQEDTEQTLAQRVLEKEHDAYPEALRIVYKSYKK